MGLLGGAVRTLLDTRHISHGQDANPGIIPVLAYIAIQPFREGIRANRGQDIYGRVTCEVAVNCITKDA